MLLKACSPTSGADLGPARMGSTQVDKKAVLGGNQLGMSDIRTKAACLQRSTR